MKCNLMHKNIPVMSFEYDDISGSITRLYETYSTEHLPVGVICANGVIDRYDLNRWWTARAIPMSRDGLIDILYTLGINVVTPLLGKNYGLSLSDQYWICPENSGITWDKVNFFDNAFSEDFGDVLIGNSDSTKDINFMSPDITSGGWLKKKWKIVDDKRVLFKGGSKPFQQEPYNEAFASTVMKRLGIPCVQYSTALIDGKPYSTCEDFIDRDTELVTAYEIMKFKKQPNHISKYEHYINCCKELGIDNIQEFLDKMITIDYIIVNEDRHLNNFGLIRNAETLKYVGIAPIYDSGSSLWFNSPDTQIKAGAREAVCKPFKDNHADQIKLVSSFDWLDFDKLYAASEELNEILKGSEFISDDRRSKICSAFTARIDILMGIAEQNMKYTNINEIGNDVTEDIAYSGGQQEQTF